jgi:Domain of unknown function (DUF1707)
VEIPPEDYRVSDRDREAFAARLATAFQDGRLDVEEYDQRLSLVYAAKTYRELIPHTLDLPDKDHEFDARPEQAPARPAPVGKNLAAAYGRMPTALRVLWIIWTSIVAVNLVVYGIVSVTAGLVYPWPLWVALPTGAVMGVVTLGVRPSYKNPKQVTQAPAPKSIDSPKLP